MNQTASQANFNENFAAYFETDLVGEADLLYRLAFAYTLNEDISFECVTKVYQGMVSALPELVKLESGAVRMRLCGAALRAVQPLKPEPTKDKSPLVGFIKTFTPEERATLVLVELAGLLPSEVASLLNKEESDVRKTLATARKQLIAFGK